MSEDALWDQGSVFRPSYSATWLNCSGSLLPSQSARDTAGIDAAVGSVFHELMAEWQKVGRPDHWLGQTFTISKEDGSGETFEVVVDEEMFVEGQRCLEHYAHLEGDVFIEQKVDISSITPIPNQKGTADRFHCLPYYVDIIDWKYGKGVKVFAENNSQELLYAWGVFDEYDWIYDFQTIRLHIAQPRLNHFDIWEISREDLIEWAAWAKERAYAAWKRNADRTATPGSCQWCKVRKDCPALEAVRAALADQSFDAIDEPVTDSQMRAVVASGSPPPAKQLPDPAVLPTAQLARIQGYRKLMEGWFNDGAEELLRRGLEGEPLDGWKIVEGRSRRRWKDDQLAVEKLGLLGIGEDEIYVRKPVSPNQAEKLLRAVGIGGQLMKSYLRMLVDRPPGKPTLVPSGDARLKIPNPSDVFDSDDDDL